MAVDLHLGHDPPRPRPTLGPVVLEHLETLHLRLAVSVMGVVGLQVGQGPGRAPLEHVVAAVAEDVQQPLGLAILVDLRHRHPGVAAHHDGHVRPGGPQGGDDGPQRRHGPATGVDRPRPQPGRQREAALAVEDEEREVLVLLVEAVVEAQDLLAVRGVVAGVEVEHDVRRRRPPRADEQLGEVVVEDLHPPRPGGLDLAQHRPVLGGQFRLPAREGVVEAVEGRAAGQRLPLARRHPHQGLEQRVVAQGLGVVAVGIAGQDLIDVLGEQGLARVGHELLGPGVGQAPGDLAQHAQFPVEQPQGQQPGVADDPTPLEIRGDLLRAEVPEGKLVATTCGHDLEPPWYSEVVGQLPLGYEVRLIFQRGGAQSRLMRDQATSWPGRAICRAAYAATACPSRAPASRRCRAAHAANLRAE